MKTLKIVIKKQWFDEIKSGKKKTEYREIKPFWTARLFDKENNPIKYDRIEFINGYSSDAGRLITEYKGVKEKDNLYHIRIGNKLRK